MALQDRFADRSPAVRDAVIDLVGKYILLKPDVAYEYYPLISARVAVSSS
jgi:cohesin loading factor subunit SCC2